jgi:hypothetical protein
MNGHCTQLFLRVEHSRVKQVCHLFLGELLSAVGGGDVRVTCVSIIGFRLPYLTASPTPFTRSTSFAVTVRFLLPSLSLSIFRPLVPSSFP